MTSLLSRLQSATGPSRELDAEIALANHPWLKDCPRDDRNGEPGWMTKDGRTYAPRYTESIDAICHDLLSDDMYWDVGRNEVGFFACVWRRGDFEHQTYGSTPALALLIAICKAKEESKS